MPTIKVPNRRNSQPYWPNELRDAGYVGSLQIHEGVCSLVIPKPSAPSKDIAKDLKILAQHFEYKAELEAREVKADRIDREVRDA